MDRTSKAILDYMVNNLGDPEAVVEFSDDPENKDGSQFVADNLKVKHSVLKAAVEYLCNVGYLRYADNGDDYVIGFCLTHRGLEYKHFELEAAIKFVMQSVIVPIIVSIITTALLIRLGLTQ